MKKYLVILVALLLVVTGCGKKEEKFKKPEKIGNSDGLVLEYESISGSVQGSPTDKISIYTDKRMILEHTNKVFEEENSSKKVYLTEKEYQDFMDIAFSKDFLNLDKNLTTTETEGGSVRYITVYYDDTSFATGGQNIHNDTFKKLEKLLLSYEEK